MANLTILAACMMMAAPAPPSPPWRQPIGLFLDKSERYLVVAQRQPAYLSVLDLQTGAIVTDHALPGRLDALSSAANGTIATVSGDRDVLEIWSASGERIEKRREIPTVAEPTWVTLSAGGATAFVSARHDRKVQAFNVADGRRLFETPLDFAPHLSVLTPDEKTLVVADAFGGGVALLDAQSGMVSSIGSIKGTNIRGLALAEDGQTLQLAHQLLAQRAIITREAVSWGALFTNNIRTAPINEIAKAPNDMPSGGSLTYIGDGRLGAGDPGMLVRTRHATLVMLEGVDEVGILEPQNAASIRVKTPARPVAAVANAAGDRAYIACQHGQSIVELDVRKHRVLRTISLGPAATLTSAQRGQIIFHRANLSHESWFSCQSCHTDGHTNGANADTQGDGNQGAPKNVPTLLGVTRTGPWGWTGQFAKLADQIESSIEHTMQGPPLGDEAINDLIDYLETLTPRPASPATLAATKGERIFKESGCVRCHAGESLTSDSVFDVGLDDGLAGHRLFNPPSLRNVSRAAPYFHDGRAPSLESVLTTHRHGQETPLSPEEAAHLLEYLRGL